MKPRRRILLLFTLLAVILLAVPAAGPAKAADEIQPHYWLARPAPAGATQKVDRGLPYGWTRNGQSPIHHGVDIPNRLGTPVLAAADGIVYFAGADSDKAFGPYPNFYGNVVVIQHNMAAPEGGTLFTLYGHLDSVGAQAGQNVGQGQPIGTVGKTGIAIWYHLHFEVRIGNPDDYSAVRNPELWYAPLPKTGTLVGRMLDSDGGLAMGIRLTAGTRTGLWPVWTYADASMRSDPAYGENFVIGDLPVGCYRLRVKNGKGGYAYDQPNVCIGAGQTVFVEVRLKPF